jgi:hypothetical protein
MLGDDSDPAVFSGGSYIVARGVVPVYKKTKLP